MKISIKRANQGEKERKHIKFRTGKIDVIIIIKIKVVKL